MSDFPNMRFDFEYRSKNAFFLAEESFLGMGPPRTLPGDIVCFLDGLQFPALLRPLDESTWAYVGLCFILGVSEIDLISKLQEGEWKIEEFNLR